MSNEIASGLVGLGVLLVIYLVVAALAREPGWIDHVIDGEDHRPSTSRFQIVLWTGAALWAYIAIVDRRLMAGQSLGPIDIPVNVFLLLGLGAATAGGAYYLTRTSPVQKTVAAREDRTYSSLLTDDAGVISLTKIQLIAWTLVAVAVFIGSTIVALSSVPSSLPDVGDAVLILLGVSQGGYLANKAAPGLIDGRTGAGQAGTS